jgi:pimeloyl-ACP methyl ester carboxylesterase
VTGSRLASHVVAVVFVHGVPVTSAVWDEVRAAIGHDSSAVSLPGFGCPRPDGFAATKEAYASWLHEQLAGFGEPVDLVGHDWGAILVARLATHQPSPSIRSWVADSVAPYHRDYVWHQLAQTWQTPQDGEAFFESYNALSFEEQTAMFTSSGVPEKFATDMARRADTTMQQCILDLYRSATELHRDWGTDLRPTAAPGLVPLATHDVFGDVVKQQDFAAAVGAKTETLDGLNHWWMLQDPKLAATVLERFWATI